MSLTRTLRRASKEEGTPTSHQAPNRHLDEKPALLPQAQWTLTSARCHGTARRRHLDPPIDAPRRSYPTYAGPPRRARPRDLPDTMPPRRVSTMRLELHPVPCANPEDRSLAAPTIRRSLRLHTLRTSAPYPTCVEHHAASSLTTFHCTSASMRVATMAPQRSCHGLTVNPITRRNLAAPLSLRHLACCHTGRERRYATWRCG